MLPQINIIASKFFSDNSKACPSLNSTFLLRSYSKTFPKIFLAAIQTFRIETTLSHFQNFSEPQIDVFAPKVFKTTRQLALAAIQYLCLEITLRPSHNLSLSQFNTFDRFYSKTFPKLVSVAIQLFRSQIVLWQSKTCLSFYSTLLPPNYFKKIWKLALAAVQHLCHEIFENISKICVSRNLTIWFGILLRHSQNLSVTQFNFLLRNYYKPISNCKIAEILFWEHPSYTIRQSSSHCLPTDFPHATAVFVSYSFVLIQ